MTKYKRVLLKLSGEALMENTGYGISSERLAQYANQIKEIVELGVETGIVIGGGNIFRGLKGEKAGLDRVAGDQMGMLATVINGLAIRATLERLGLKTALFTAIRMEPVGKGYSPQMARESLERGEVAIFSGGTGNPFFTTDSAAALRALEIKAEVLLKGTRVDGVYTADPEKDPGAVKFDRLTFEEAYKKDLKIMDLTAFTLCRDNNLPLIVFNMNQPGNLLKIVQGNNPGTFVFFP